MKNPSPRSAPRILSGSSSCFLWMPFFPFSTWVHQQYRPTSTSPSIIANITLLAVEKLTPGLKCPRPTTTNNVAERRAADEKKSGTQKIFLALSVLLVWLRVEVLYSSEEWHGSEYRIPANSSSGFSTMQRKECQPMEWQATTTHKDEFVAPCDQNLPTVLLRHLDCSVLCMTKWFKQF